MRNRKNRPESSPQRPQSDKIPVSGPFGRQNIAEIGKCAAQSLFFVIFCSFWVPSGVPKWPPNREKVVKIDVCFSVVFRTSFFIDFYWFLRLKTMPKSMKNREKTAKGNCVRICVSLKRKHDFQGSERLKTAKTRSKNLPKKTNAEKT